MAQRTWFITGVNSGFGRLMSEALLECGDRVAGTVRKLDSMNDLKTKYGDRLWVAHLDMTDLSEIHNVVEKAFVEFGRIDVIVSNAGYGLFGAAEELSDEQVAHQLSTNLVGPIQLVRAALPHLRAQGGGRIIGLSTYGAKRPFRAALFITRASGGLRAFLTRLARNSRRSRSALRSWSRVEPGQTSALAGRSLAHRSKLTRARRPRWSTR
jgi:NAD(P)-dependent dehydrogenase (short-subunit alcohol dehydrogenase family)